MAERSTGFVKWFEDKKGYGFITLDDGRGDVFVHYKDIVGQAGRKTLKKDQRVTLTVEKGPRGPKAGTVEVTG